jgi:hypothetical protein
MQGREGSTCCECEASTGRGVDLRQVVTACVMTQQLTLKAGIAKLAIALAIPLACAHLRCVKAPAVGLLYRFPTGSVIQGLTRRSR